MAARKLSETSTSKPAKRTAKAAIPAVEFSDSTAQADMTNQGVEVAASVDLMPALKASLPAAKTAPTAAPTAKQLRQFAADSGLEVKARGSLPKAVHEAFSKANAKTRKKYLTV